MLRSHRAAPPARHRTGEFEPAGAHVNMTLLTAIAAAVLALLCSMAIRIVPEGSRLGRLALGLVFGGAAGNLLDRWRFGAVVDYFHVFWRDWHWPNFNVADSAITIGVLLLAAELAFARHEEDAHAASR